MTLREEVFEYLRAWTQNNMHTCLSLSPRTEEQDACFLVNGFENKMDVLQNASNEIFHSTMMDMHYGGSLRNGFRTSVFEIYFNAREPEYTDAAGLASALDRAQTMLDGFIRGIVADNRQAKKQNTRALPFWFDIENLQWDTAGPFGDGWETVVLYLHVTLPFDYCYPQS